MSYLELLHKAITTSLECEEDLAFCESTPTVRRIVRVKSVLRAMKKDIDVLAAELEVKKKELIKNGSATQQLADEIEKEFQK